MIQEGEFDCETEQFWAWGEFVVRRQCSSGKDTPGKATPSEKGNPSADRASPVQSATGYCACLRGAESNDSNPFNPGEESAHDRPFMKV